MPNLNTIFNPTSSSYPISPNIGWNNSWLNVQNADRELFAQAVYPVNIDQKLDTIISLLSAISIK